MQQTDKYKLNLIETSDAFSPEGLNANTQKIEEVLKGMEAGPLAEMDGRVTALEAHKIVVGEYVGNDRSGRFIDIGATPQVVVVYGSGYTNIGLKGLNGSVIPVENGFNAGTNNSNGATYRYFAII